MLLLAGAGCAAPAPAAPGEDEPAYLVSRLVSWALVGDARTEGTDAMQVRVTPPPDVEGVVAWLDGVRVGELIPGDGAFELGVPLQDVVTGEHELLLALPERTWPSRPIASRGPTRCTCSCLWIGTGPTPPTAS